MRVRVSMRVRERCQGLFAGWLLTFLSTLHRPTLWSTNCPSSGPLWCKQRRAKAGRRNRGLTCGPGRLRMEATAVSAPQRRSGRSPAWQLRLDQARPDPPAAGALPAAPRSPFRGVHVRLKAVKPQVGWPWPESRISVVFIRFPSGLCRGLQGSWSRNHGDGTLETEGAGPRHGRGQGMGGANLENLFRKGEREEL